ncbi:MAG TPA: dienelactone hydrolase family protein [Jatrophihabitans sp.]
MADVVLFHHIQGVTPGIVAFADELRAAGHTVHTPDLFDGRTFASIEEGMEFVDQQQWQSWLERGIAAADALPGNAVYSGFSFGVTSAQKLAMTREDARGALLFESFIPPEWFGEWTPSIPVQIHGKEDDEFFAEELPAARAFAAANPGVELHTYTGSEHLFADRSLASYDSEAASLLIGHVLDYLAAL